MCMGLSLSGWAGLSRVDQELWSWPERVMPAGPTRIAGWHFLWLVVCHMARIFSEISAATWWKLAGISVGERISPGGAGALCFCPFPATILDGSTRYEYSAGPVKIWFTFLFLPISGHSVGC